MAGILQGWFGPFPQTNNAQDVDSSGQPYYGEAPRGASRTSKRWSIYMNMTISGTATMFQFPVDVTTGLGSDQGIFIMAHATDGTYTYASLGVPPILSP